MPSAFSRWTQKSSSALKDREATGVLLAGVVLAVRDALQEAFGGELVVGRGELLLYLGYVLVIAQGDPRLQGEELHLPRLPSSALLVHQAVEPLRDGAREGEVEPGVDVLEVVGPVRLNEVLAEMDAVAVPALAGDPLVLRQPRLGEQA